MQQEITASIFIRENLRQQLKGVPGSVVELKENSVDELTCFELQPKVPSLCPLTIRVISEDRYDVYVGIQGRFEYVKLDAEEILQFVKAVLHGDVIEDIWQWNGRTLKAVIQVKTSGKIYTQKWSSLAGIITLIFLQPWVRKQQRLYEPYMPNSSRQSAD